MNNENNNEKSNIAENEAIEAEKANETEAKETPESTEEIVKERIAEYRERSKESLEAMKEGKGRLKLETPISMPDKTTIDELVYDFTALTGLEYTEAMDSDYNASQIFRITYRQGLALFAKAAAKQTPGLDMRDITERIGITDAVEGVQLATSFFSASTRAGRLPSRSG